MKKIFVSVLTSLCIAGGVIVNLQAQEIQSSKMNAISENALPAMESEAFSLINQYRVSKLLNPLNWSSSPAHLAREHSLNMAEYTVPFGHQGVELRYETLRKKNPSLTRFGENVAYNFGYPNPAQEAVKGWLASPEHHANIIGDYNFAGIGVAMSVKGEYYFTQVFIKADPVKLSSDSIDSKDATAETSSTQLNN